MTASPKYWVMIPAAGTGARMQTELPKQYLKIRGKCILEYVLERFCIHPKIEAIVVALAENDPYWKDLTMATHDKIICTTGGTERCHSVLNGLKTLSTFAAPDDWVLVHDAARPCLHSSDIDHLLDELDDHPVGGLLALPVRDTIKRSDADDLVSETVNREGLWHALTPQMFRLGSLQRAITTALSEKLLVTDEAQAMERLGNKPVLVQGRPDNIKITHHSDLALAELFLSQQEAS